MRACLCFAAVLLACGAARAGPGAQRKASPAPEASKVETGASGRPIVKGPLSLSAAEELSLKYSPLVGASRAELSMAAARRDLAKAEARPRLSANSFLTGGSEAMIHSTPAPVMPWNLTGVPHGEFFNQNLTLMLPLYTSGRISGNIGRAGAETQAAGNDWRSAQLEVKLRTRLAYRTVLLADATVRVHEEDVRLSQEQLRVDQAKLEAGTSIAANVARDQARLAQAKQELTNARRDLAIGLTDLKTVIGLDPASDLQLTNKLLAAPHGYQPETMLEAARKNRPEVAAAEERVLAAGKAVQVARGTYRPQVGLAVMGDQAVAEGASGFAGYSAGVVVGYPVFTGRARQAETKGARAALERAGQLRDQVLLQVGNEVQVVWQQMTAAEQNIRTAEEAVAAAQENYRVMRLRFDVGKAINVELQDALTTLVQARVNLVRALYEYNAAVDTARRVVGES